MNKSIVDIDEEVEKIFKSYQWPGNIRELKNVIEGAFNLTSSNLIQKKDLPAYLIEQVKARNISLNIKSKGFSLQEMVEKFECEIIDETIKSSSSYADAAKKLKLSKQALNYKLNKYSLNK
jgi:arginine utilization regulatory protein